MIISFMERSYSPEHWSLLNSLRRRAIAILEELSRMGMRGNVYGSIARGDVNQHSDIDVVVENPDFIKLDMIPYSHRFVVQATPKSTPKVYISLDPEEKEIISFPIGKLTRDEYFFFKFGGMISLDEMKEGKRVPGINKQLLLIIPRKDGHTSVEVNGNEAYVSKVIGIPLSTVKERERVLQKRKEQGRTGVFFKYELYPNESILEALNNIKRRR
ncbi:DNA polymerase subunit beta [Sulfolobales archaeon HS-7]|nr:DNA polymerase subunit beta [Sulfolobales archaeon HS-7]